MLEMLGKIFVNLFVKMVLYVLVNMVKIRMVVCIVLSLSVIDLLKMFIEI